MAKLTKKQMETLVDFGYHSLMAEKFDGYGTKAMKTQDWDDFNKCMNACYRNADIAVKMARELGMTDKQIDDVCVSLLLWSKYYNEKAAA